MIWRSWGAIETVQQNTCSVLYNAYMQAIAQINTQVWVLHFEEYMERLKNV